MYETNDSGVATLTYEFGTASGKQRITVTTLNLGSKEVTAELTSSDPSQILSEKSNEKQPGDSKKYDLVALVEDDGDPVLGKVVTFRTNNGIFDSCFCSCYRRHRNRRRGRCVHQCLGVKRTSFTT